VSTTGPPLETDPREAPVAVYADVGELDPAPGIAHLESCGFTVRVLDTGDADLIAEKAPDARALMIGYARVDETLLAGLPRLGIVCTQSAGVDTIDLAAAARHDVLVANVPGGATEEVATHALAMATGLCRGLPFLDRAVRDGAWDAGAEPLRRLSSTTLGVVGMGRIGRRLAHLAGPLFDAVIGHDPVLPPDHWPESVPRCSLDELLADSDLVSLHAPLTADSRGLLGARELALMRRGAFLVNVARGELVDHEAMLDALDSGGLGGAALDVLPEEPPSDGRLLRHPRLWLTPHAAYLSDASGLDYVLTQARNATSWLATGAPLHPVDVGR
jgi:D-3-phosphoglycerate dehydrogenase